MAANVSLFQFEFSEQVVRHMKTFYHYQLADQVYGPVSFDDLVQRVQKGVLQPETLVNSNVKSVWVQAASIEGLFLKAGKLDLLEIWEEKQASQESLSPEELQQLREQEALEEQRAQVRMDLALAAAHELTTERSMFRFLKPLQRFFAALFSK